MQTMEVLALFEAPNQSESAGNPGPVERSFIEQMDHLESARVMTKAHSGIKSLVLRSARAVDQIKPSDAASGQAQLIKALAEVAAQLPAPRAEEVSVIEALRELFIIDTAQPGEFDQAPQEAR